MQAKASGFAFAGVALVSGLAIGAGVALTFFVPTTPEVLQSSSSARTVPVTMQDFTDPRTVDIAVSVGAPQGVSVSRSGIITAWSCRPGESIESGKSAVTLDGVPLVSLSTSVPLWRDLSVGDDGADVSALEAELARLGYAVDGNGTLSYRDLAAFSKLASSVGADVKDVVPRDAVVWLPAAAVEVDKCEIGLGSNVSAGQLLASVSADVEVAPVALPEGRIPGPRLLNAFGEPLALGDAGELPTDLPAGLVRKSPLFREAVGGSDNVTSVTLKGTAVLATPVQVASVPATAVQVLDNGNGCVFTDTSPYAVKIVGSEFGNSFVLFADATPPTSVLSSVPKEHQECG